MEPKPAKRRTTLADVERSIRDSADLSGWRRHQPGFGISRPPEVEGFPQVVVIRGGFLVFLTIASSKGTLETGQDAWITALSHVHTIETQIVYRDDLVPVTRRLQQPRPVSVIREVAQSGEPAQTSRPVGAGLECTTQPPAKRSYT